MSQLSQYRDPRLNAAVLAEIARVATRPWAIMEVCGGQTNTLVRQGIDEVLPAGIRMIHGPGCPVCVTPLEVIDQALAIAATPGVIFTSFGDMLRVPGSTTDLLRLRAAGADVRVVYSPMQALDLAAANPDRQVVFFAIGFETTAPASAMCVLAAEQRQLANFSVLVSQVLVPPAVRAVLSAPDNEVQAILAAGHVCAVTGFEEYLPIAERYQVPIVVTGFEPLDLLCGIRQAVEQLERGRHTVVNAYARAVRRQGNPHAMAAVRQVFEVADATWRGIGEIQASGMRLRSRYAAQDARVRFPVADITAVEHPDCVAGSVLRGAKAPVDCPAYGTACRPDNPLGAPMVSAEGTCAAYYTAGRPPRRGVTADVAERILVRDPA